MMRPKQGRERFALSAEAAGFKDIKVERKMMKPVSLFKEEMFTRDGQQDNEKYTTMSSFSVYALTTLAVF